VSFRKNATYSNALGVPPGDEVVSNSDEETNEPEPVDPSEQGTRTEHPLRTDNTPDDTGVVEGRGTGADEALRLSLRAELRNIAEEEVVSGDLDEGEPDSGEELSAEHGARRNFHLCILSVAVISI
jgi:hypothetical protein